MPNPFISSEIIAEATTGSDTAIAGSGSYSSASTPVLVSMAAGCGVLLLLVTILIFYLRKRLCNIDRKDKPVRNKHLQIIIFIYILIVYYDFLDFKF